MDLVLRHIPGTRDPLDKPSPWYVLIEAAGGDGVGPESQVETALARRWHKALTTDATIAAQPSPGAGALADPRQHFRGPETRRRLDQA